MGMFSEIEVRDTDTDTLNDALRGNKWQFKAGNDSLDVFHLGDEVPRKPSSMPGDVNFGDGAYHAVAIGDSYPDVWVIIKDKTIHDIVVHPSDTREGYYEEILLARYEIVEYEREWWSEEEWFAQDLEKAERDFKFAQEHYEFTKACLPLNPEQRKRARMGWVASAFADMMSRKMNHPGFAARVLTVRPIGEDGAKAKPEKYEEPPNPSLAERIASVVEAALPEPPPPGDHLGRLAAMIKAI